MKGGKLIGEGAFGEVYDNLIDDIGPIESLDVIKYNGLANTFYINDLKENCIFKLVFYRNERDQEMQSMKTLHELFFNNKFEKHCLHNEVLAIKNDCDTFLVYQKFENNLQKHLFQSVGDGYLKEWGQTNIVCDTKLIEICVENALNMLEILHSNDLVHKDIKLDNFLIRKNDVILADYGLVSKLSDFDIGWGVPFQGLVDFTPPFCHGDEDDSKEKAIEKYTKRMNALFSHKSLNEKSKYPRSLVGSDFFYDVAISYNIQTIDVHNNVDMKKKIDMHALGIVILQLVARCENKNNEALVSFAKKLMLYNTKLTYKYSQVGGGYINILGRRRKIYTYRNRAYVKVNNELITLNKAKKLLNLK